MDASTSEVQLSIVIVNWNTRRLLYHCIESIRATAQGVRYEVIIVDNGSTDESVDLVRSRFPEVRLIESETNLGFSRAANRAILQSQGAFVLMAHPDVRFENGAIPEMLAWLQQNERVAVVGANLVYPDGSWNECQIQRRNLRIELRDVGFPFDRLDDLVTALFRRIGVRREPVDWDHESVSETATVWNACMLFRRAVYDRVGPFDESFRVWFADTDWCYRVRAGGWSLQYLPSATVVHYERQSGDLLETSETRYKVDGVGVIGLMRKDLAQLHRKHYGLPYRVIAGALRLLAGIKAHLRLLLRRQTDGGH